MNETIKNIIERRSIRNFNQKKIKREDLELIVECAIHSPSARGLDTYRFIVINNDEMIDELIKIMRKLLNDDNYTMYHPKALIIPTNKKDNPYAIEDNACALENIFIAAKSLDIGSVWINQLRNYNDTQELRDYLSKFNVDDTMMVTGIAALGYTDEKPKAKNRLGQYQIFE